jgi:hypothetical protein
MVDVRKHIIDGREIRIIIERIKIDEFHLTPDEAEKCILNICSDLSKQKDSIIKCFSSLNFVLRKVSKLDSKEFSSHMGYISNDSAWYFATGVLKPENTLYVNILKFFSENQGRLEEVVLHELTHLWHKQISNFSSVWNVRNKLPPQTYIEKMTLKNIMFDIRSEYINFLAKIVVEGIGKFGGLFLSNNIYFTKEKSEDILLEARRAVASLRQSFRKMQKLIDDASPCLEMSLQDKKSKTNDLEKYKKNLIKEIYKSYLEIKTKLKSQNHIPYDLGLHIIYTILYVDKNINFQELANMNYIKIVRKYEVCAAQSGFTPLLSYNSKNGFIDYADLVNTLNEQYKKYKDFDEK